MILLNQVVRLYLQTLKQGGTLYFAGCGGCASLSEHLAAEYVGRYMADRPPLRAISLTQPSSVITAIGNDYGFQYIFSRQVELLRPTDVLTLYSTSGRSPCILEAANVSPAPVVFFTGENGPSSVAVHGGLYLRLPQTNTAELQQEFLRLSHRVCELVEAGL